MTFDTIVKKIVREFERSTKDKGHSAVLTTILNDHREAIVKSLTKRKRQRNKDDGEAKESGETDSNAANAKPKRANWQAYWTSNEFGCRAYEPFHERMAGLEKEHPEMLRFALNRELKVWATENGSYAQWQAWAKEKIEAAGKLMPVEPAVKVAKPAKASKSTLNAESVAAAAAEAEAAERPAAAAAAVEVSAPVAEVVAVVAPTKAPAKPRAKRAAPAVAVAQ